MDDYNVLETDSELLTTQTQEVRKSFKLELNLFSAYFATLYSVEIIKRIRKTWLSALLRYLKVYSNILDQLY